MSKFLDLTRKIYTDPNPPDIVPVEPKFKIEESLFTGDPSKDYAVITGDKAYSNEAVIAFIEYESGLPDWEITPGWQGYGGCYRRADELYEWKVNRKEE